jgi:type I restriction enzyme S subunit
MAAEWTTATVLELQRDGVLLVEDGNHGEYRPRPDEFVSAGVAFIRAADMDAGRVLFESAARINKKAQDRITKGIGAPGDVLLSHKGTVGKVAMVGDDAPAFVCSPQTTFWRTLDQERLDRKHLYAFLRSSGFHAQLATRAGETDMAPYVSLTSQRGLSVTVPPIGTQRAITHILGTLDDKIELNRRMNETLEAMVRALFKSWFVDFDPVRAKARGRDPGLPKPLADLFPDSFEDSELGEIPKGWEGRRWGDLVTLEYGKSLTNYANGDDAFPVFGTNGKIGSHSEPLCSHPGIIIGRKGAYRGVHYCRSPFFVIDTAFYVEPKINLELRWAYYELLRQDINAMDSGSAIPSTSREDFYGLPVLAAPREVQERFVKLLEPLWDRQEQNERESQLVAALRDTLLPKLISGELRVNEAERIVSKSDQSDQWERSDGPRPGRERT